jgi:ABC-2 type transport system ATP-binding protein
MYRLSVDTVRDRCRELLAMMNLDNEEKKLTLEYSHGMKKKLALAAALIPNPDVLFLDEPFEGIDAVSSSVLRDVLKRAVQRGATVFLTSHILEIVEKLCTAVGSSPSRLMYQGTMDEVRQSGSLEDRFLQVVVTARSTPDPQLAGGLNTGASCTRFSGAAATRNHGPAATQPHYTVTSS